VYLSWETSYAGPAALSHYEIFRGDGKIGEVKHRPQTTLKPFTFRDPDAETGPNTYRVRAVDEEKTESEWAEITVDCPAAPGRTS
jgi:hypothetical protein